MQVEAVHYLNNIPNKDMLKKTDLEALVPPGSSESHIARLATEFKLLRHLFLKGNIGPYDPVAHRLLLRGV